MILLDDVSKEFHVKKNGATVSAICRISLYLPEGTILGIIGASGAGKTTLLKMIAGLLKPSSGRVRIGDCDPVIDQRELSGQIYMLSAEHENLDPRHSLEENLATIPLTYSLDQEIVRNKQEEVLFRFSLSEKRKSKIRDLSLGYRRRAEVVMALLTPTRVLLLDEPSIGMDEEAKEVFAELIREEKKYGRTVLVSSHDLREIQNLSDRILLMHQGRALFYGENERLYHKIAPEKHLSMKLSGKFPDLQDLPYIRYEQEGDQLTLTYDSNRVTAAELLQGILQSGTITKVSVIKPELSEVIAQISKGNGG